VIIAPTASGTISRSVPRTPSEAIEAALVPDAMVTVRRSMLGGSVAVHLRTHGSVDDAERQAAAVLSRLAAWASRLTRFDPTSDLCRVNADPGHRVRLSATLAALLDQGRSAERSTDGIVDIAMLAERLAAEGIDGASGPPRIDDRSRASRTWSLERGGRRTFVHRPSGLSFDLDGIAKGWLADRALGRLDRHPVAVVDADGDIAIWLEGGASIDVGIAHPSAPATDIAVFELRAAGDGRSLGVATSGTTVHRWQRAGRRTHHLIDPRTGAPAVTDLVQASVMAATASQAEVFAKAAVIVGAERAVSMLGRRGVEGAILITDRDEMLVLPGTPWRPA
jgi:FAD:protein FMN transferase